MVAGVSKAEGLDPSTVSEARTRLDWPRWEIAINAELKSLEDTCTWDIVECPNGMNVVGNKWIFKIKCNAASEIEKYKARLVAKGYSQVQGVDYDDTYAPVTQLSSLRTILAIATCNDWDIDVFDFHSAFLNGKLSEGEDIYMQLPEGYATSGKYTRPVAKLNVALYGSKQGVLRWYQELSKSLGELRLTCAHADWRVFYGQIGHNILMLASHVDDCTVTGNSAVLIHSFKQEVRSRYKITDLGPISWLLGMKVTCDREARTISLSQQTYTEAILTKYNLADCKQASCHSYGPWLETLTQSVSEIHQRSCAHEKCPLSCCHRITHALGSQNLSRHCVHHLHGCTIQQCTWISALGSSKTYLQVSSWHQKLGTDLRRS